MTPAAWLTCLAWLALTLAISARAALRGLRAGRAPHATARLKSPTIYLFAAYLLIAACVTPRTPGESTSPLLWLAIILPLAYAIATFSAIGAPRRSPLTAIALALLHAGAVLAASAIILALASPAFVPAPLRP